MRGQVGRLAPLTGLVFVGLFIGLFAISGSVLRGSVTFLSARPCGLGWADCARLCRRGVLAVGMAVVGGSLYAAADVASKIK